MNAIPRQYIDGRVNFFGRELVVTPDVLIPRFETEILVEEAVSILKEFSGRGYADILDIGTGSGNIAISLTSSSKKTKIVASDVSESALEIARSNAEINGVSDRIEFIISDLFNNIRGYFDMIISNPPYVASEELASLDPEVLSEPRVALDGGPGGLFFLRKIIEETPYYLKGGGYLLMEIGYDQADAAMDILKASALERFELKKDYAGIDRVIIARNNG